MQQNTVSLFERRSRDTAVALQPVVHATVTRDKNRIGSRSAAHMPLAHRFLNNFLVDHSSMRLDITALAAPMTAAITVYGCR